MKTKKGRPDYNRSEPESLIEAMNRHESWATIVCLVGGGQEIYDGEAGIAEWFDSLRRCFRDWDVYVAPELNDSEYCRGTTWEDMIRDLNPKYDRDLHLRNSIRSFRTPDLSSFVKNLLDVNKEAAKQDLERMEGKYPIFVTRDLDKAKEWIKKVSKGNCRHGIVASSKGLRLKPSGIFVKNEKNVVEWFLGDKKNVLSSYFMEEVATEFEIQGLEIDYAIVAWDADFHFNKENNCWEYYNFRGSRWMRINKEIDQRYLLNAYRVLLTRARQGMIIFVPEGSKIVGGEAEDDTRSRDKYDGTYEYLCDLGVDTI